MLDISTTLKYYKQKSIQKAILDCAENKEIAIRFNEFVKRPEVLRYEQDVLEFAKQGATSFHCSEELWSNPLQLTTEIKKNDLEELRIGWDLIIDIDTKIFSLAKKATHLTIEALKYADAESFSVKFSGNNGFHIALPFESFPETVQGSQIKKMFPEGPRKIAEYLKHLIKPFLEKEIQNYDLTKLINESGKSKEEILKNKQIDPFTIVGIDTVLISSRHLYRMPYSLNEKSGLASLPINPEKVLTFEKQQANPEKVNVEKKFLERNCQKGSSRKLFIQAFDHKTSNDITTEINVKKITKKNQENFEEIKIPIKEENFPPCIKKILKGLTDGKKRSVFILINFLHSIGWNHESIEEFLTEWNKKNTEPLKDQEIKGQIAYHKKQNKKILPPNCQNKGYYIDFGVCNPDSLCNKIKNPANYSILKQKQKAL